MKRYWLLIFDPAKEAVNKFSFIRHCGSIEEALFDAQEDGLESYQVFDSLEKKVVTVIGAGQPLYEYVIPFSIVQGAFQRAVNEKLNVDLFPVGDPGYRILMRKLSHYGPTEAAVDLAADEYIKIHSLNNSGYIDQLANNKWQTFSNEVLGLPAKHFEKKSLFMLTTNDENQIPVVLSTFKGSALDLVHKERVRQIETEKWDDDHDDSHSEGALALAGASYMVAEDMRRKHKHLTIDSQMGLVPQFWPFDLEWFKQTPDDRIRELVKGCALGLAEIERLQRKAKEDLSKNDVLASSVFTGHYSRLVVESAIFCGKDIAEVMLSEMPPLKWFEERDNIGRKSLWIYSEVMKEHGFFEKL